MDIKLQKKLFRKYKYLFKDTSKPMSQTAMCWGIQCGNGWYDLIDNLCEYITWNMDHNAHCFPKIHFSTIKEKFGTLRIYHMCNECSEEQVSGNRDFNGAISFAESLSGTICESCGKKGKRIEVNKWMLTVCDECLEKYKKERGIK